MPASHRLDFGRGLDTLGSSSAECASMALVASAWLQILQLTAIMPHRYALLVLLGAGDVLARAKQSGSRPAVSIKTKA